MLYGDERVQAAFARIPELETLIREVDRSILRWSLDLSPLDRVRILNERARGLARFEHVPSENR